jgi:putative ABC transport system permease protein
VGTGEGVLVDTTLDARVLTFTTIVAVVTGLLFSLAPALRAARTDASRPGAATMSPPAPRVRLGQSLVVVQVTLSLVLLCGAVLFLQTLRNLAHVESGFDRQGVLTMQVDATVPRPSPTATPSADDRRRAHAQLGAMWEELRARILTMPGVTSAAAGTMAPLTDRDRGVNVAVSGASLPESDRSIHVNQVTAGFFETMGIRAIAGRAFTSADRAGSARVAILNHTAARAYFGRDSALGRQINFPGQQVEDEYEIVGVVEDVRCKPPDAR